MVFLILIRCNFLYRKTSNIMENLYSIKNWHKNDSDYCIIWNTYYSIMQLHLAPLFQNFNYTTYNSLTRGQQNRLPIILNISLAVCYFQLFWEKEQDDDYHNHPCTCMTSTISTTWGKEDFVWDIGIYGL